MNDLGVERAHLQHAWPGRAKVARWEPTLWNVNHAGRALVIKDIRHSNPLYRFTLGRWLLGREARAYRALQEFPFVPHCHGWLDRDSIVLQRLDATSLTKYPIAKLRPALFDALADQIAALHRRHIAHLDLRHRSNILVTEDGEPRLIDFASTMCLEQSPVRRKLFWPLFAAIDRSGLIKWRLRYFPDQVSEEDRRWYQRMRRWQWLWPWKRLWAPRRNNHERPARQPV